MSKLPTWNLSLLYASPSDPRIERDLAALDSRVAAFAAEHGRDDAPYLADRTALKKALEEYERLVGSIISPALIYFYAYRDIDAGNAAVQAHMALLEGRMAKNQNLLSFFEIRLGSLPKEARESFLNDPSLAHFKVFLSRIFDDAKHMKSVAEEQILNLKSQTSYEMWISANERILNQRTVAWKGKKTPISQAIQMIPTLKSFSDRERLAKALNAELASVAPIAEAELNAIFTNKKIDDEIRGFATPYESAVLSYRNDPAAVESLIKAVESASHIAHSFFKVKARLLGKKRLSYNDRGAKVGGVKGAFSYESSLERLKEVFGAIDPKYRQTLERFAAEGRIDALPRVGKKGGAYCLSAYGTPTFVMLNHIGELRSFTTFAHEMGHAFHAELSRPRGPIYSNYSIALAETASTLFEAIALESAMNSLSPAERIVVLHDKISDDIATTFRQIACFGFERDLHEAVRSKGYVPHAEIAAMHNARMASYLGPIFDMKAEDGYAFVYWEHIRRFFYVYTYAYGALVSKAMLRRYKKDPTFWANIERFLAAGGEDSPENILKSIGIDVTTPTFWLEGLEEIAADIQKLSDLIDAQKAPRRKKK